MKVFAANSKSKYLSQDDDEEGTGATIYSSIATTPRRTIVKEMKIYELGVHIKVH